MQQLNPIVLMHMITTYHLAAGTVSPKKGQLSLKELIADDKRTIKAQNLHQQRLEKLHQRTMSLSHIKKPLRLAQRQVNS